MQRANLYLLAEMNREPLTNHPAADELRARLDSYELAFRMQAQVPDLLDLKERGLPSLRLARRRFK